jgi:FlaA1/EpsC-like NDP-sugar epimerase
MTRFFMSVQEAVQLVLQASLLSRGRDIFMLEMGEPVPIMELARRMIELSGGTVGLDIEIKVTGMRRGEKLAEDLREPDEEVLGTEHPSISRLLPVMPPRGWFDSCLVQLAEATRRGDDDRVRELLFLSAGEGERTESDSRPDGDILLNGKDEISAPVHSLQHRHQPAEPRSEPADA